tara:strand:- start:762 stop:935 length:174 start_codon:yes stop_codon:yes gene_type:complete
MIDIIQTILVLNPSAVVTVYGTDLDTCDIQWLEGTAPISKEDIKSEMDRQQAIEDAK